MNSLSDLVEKLKDVEADRLVDLLRTMHNEGVQPDWGASSLPLPLDGTPAAKRTPASAAPGPAEASTHDAARGFFVDLEDKLRKQQTTADALIDRLRARERRSEPRTQETAPAQQLVSIVALAGSRAGGRFVVAHPGDAPVRVELRVGSLRAADGRTLATAVTLEPAVFELAPRSRRIVKAAFDLAGCEVRDRERLTATIDALGARGRCLMKVLVEIEIHREDDDAPAA